MRLEDIIDELHNYRIERMGKRGERLHEYGEKLKRIQENLPNRITHEFPSDKDRSQQAQ